ncbi:hypothetical protein GOV11_04695 [Candidatus Woesearchaeota archaeon]|nr:hypothetical protein [Candidatus Woesearchaeota archaeon]
MVPKVYMGPFGKFDEMAWSHFVTLWLGYANAFIAIFILIYAYMFLKKTNKHRDRRPWDFLFIASVIFLIYEIFIVMFLSGVTSLSTLDLQFINNTMAFLYAGCVLLAFISQHDLILKSQIILISKKDASDEEEIDIQIGGKKK